MKDLYIGQEVKIPKLRELLKIPSARYDGDGDIIFGGSIPCFTDGMMKWCGEWAVVTDFSWSDNSVKLDIDEGQFHWANIWFNINKVRISEDLFEME